jgi:regulator of RNase E activity RraA
MLAGSKSGDTVIAEAREKLFCALLSDVLDSLGYEKQALPPRVRPLDEALVMVGRARTMLYADVYARPAPDTNPYELEIKLVDDLRAGDIAVCSCGGTGRIAPWGGLLSTAAKYRGAAGALMDGLVRDIKDIREMQFPVFHAGIGPLDSKGRGEVVAIDVPVECAGVLVQPGDLIFGDADGCVIIPKKIEAEVLAAAYDKLKAENHTREALRAGRKLADVFAEFGVL